MFELGMFLLDVVTYCNGVMHIHIQILMNRSPEDQYTYLDAHPRHVRIPHRLMSYPPDVRVMSFSNFFWCC